MLLMLLNRWRMGGKAPAAWGMTKVMFGHRDIVPDEKRLISARAVSNMNSNIGFGNLGRNVMAVCSWPLASSVCLQQGVVGWMKTVALIRFSSLKTVSSEGSPR